MQTTGFGWRLVASALLVALAGQALAQSAVPQYVVADADTRTGSVLKRKHGTGYPIPPRRRYGQLTEEQKAIVHSWYEHLGQGDADV